ncbi:MAG: anti-sigma factor antagonist [Methylococcus sp.]|jgi:anti-anti-sigma factor|nr:MAG: anti-sigma factor antagonist [Methylococcus sp.]
MLSISTEKKGNALVLTLNGRLDANSAKELEAEALVWIEGGDHQHVLDFSGVNFISSAGLRAILLIAKRLEPIGGKVKLCGLNATLMDVFEISGFSKLFVIVPTVAEAI